ncbi:MAG TPA: DNA-3-methyladenine glycosylase [Terriglobales bacterium]|nr:DNA-3-methyladenine glycosylase [Terriglobales bacterium]
MRGRGKFDLQRVRPLTVGFYDRDPRRVARGLLGKVVVRQWGREHMAGRIVEVEAYLGTDDAAAHAAAGLTPRNRVLFGPPGRSYVYFIYGNYYCLNVSCLPDGIAGGVLFRALEPLAGLRAMARNRGLSGELTERSKRLLTSGPGRLCEALKITRARDNDLDMTSPDSGVWIGDNGYRPPRIAVTRRIGITKSAEQPLRYVIAGNKFVSGPKVGSQEAINR